MAPVPQEHATIEAEVDTSSNPDRVVISGMSGLYPDCNHVKDLQDILYNKKNPVTAENIRWKYNHPEVAQHTGKVPQLDRFDAQFFKVHYRLSQSMDSMARKILEQAYQAIYDAGVSPEHLSGKKVGVYIGTCFSETEKACFYVASSRTGFGIAGCSKTMFANRISYWLNAKGPSLSIDEACCSSLAALEQAYQALTRGECEAAIVGGGNLCLHPQSSVHYARIMKLCMDGKTKSFDQNADGCAKSDAINVLFLQKAKDALRIYADVLYVKSEFTGIVADETGGPRYGFYRQPAAAARFLTDFYKEARVAPARVEYVEAFGSAIPEADKAELDALGQVFCQNRTTPLKVGSVMSNIGYTEAASGISAVTKVLLGYHTGQLAGNLHCDSPRRDVASIQDGRMTVLTDHSQFNRTYAAINGISVTGVNAHVLLHGRYKPKDLNRYKASFPQLVTVSGRQESAVKRILDELKSMPVDPEQLTLLRNIHETRISGHMGRGFTILDTDGTGATVSLREKAEYFDDARRPLWFVYSGMGSQWSGMAAQLMRLPVFAAAIHKCHRVLEPKGIDIMNIITSPEKTMFDNILHSFVGIAAVQIGLTDVLKALGIVPDKIIGHSVGELGCAYADGCFSAEEMILAAYSRGLVSVQTNFIRGSMAAVGIGYQEVVKLLPAEIEVACHNSSDSSTISGPADVMKQFVAELTAKGIFAKEVPCSNIAYHSRYIREAGPGLLKYLREVIKSPKPRSERWVSTSVPHERWNEEIAKYSSPEYHTNNLLNPVLFEETSSLIPSNAVCVEIAPHGLLQAILKRSLPSCQHIPLTRRGHPDNVLMVLEGVGRLYMEGFNPKVKELYPKVELPVSTGTPMLSHLVEWAHNEKWNLPLYVSAHRKMAAACQHVISVYDEEHKYLEGNVIRGRNMYPFSAALFNIWDTLLMSSGLGHAGRGAGVAGAAGAAGVTFTHLRLHAAPALHKERALTLSAQLHRGTKQFEILAEHSKVATGYVSYEIEDLTQEFNKVFIPQEELTLNQEDIYRILNERDYSYTDDFRSIMSSNPSFTEAKIIWKDNWVTFIDGILQLLALRENYDGVSRPFMMRRLTVDLAEHGMRMKRVGNEAVFTAHVFEEFGFVRCGGVIIENVKMSNMPPMVEKEVTLKKLKFFPRVQRENVDISTTLQVHLQILSENISKDVINVVGIPTLGCDDKVFNEIAEVANNVPGIVINYDQIQRQKILEERDHFLTEADLVVVQNLSTDENLCQSLYRVLQRDTFVLNIEQNDFASNSPRPSSLYRIVSSYNTGNFKIELTKWRPTVPSAATTAVTVKCQSDIELLKNMRKEIPSRQKVIIFASYPIPAGLKDLVKRWREEPERNQIFVFAVNEREAESLFDKLPELDLAFNTLQNGVWGGEYYIESSEDVKKDGVVRLQSAGVNDLQTMFWTEVPASKEKGIPIQVHYASLNDLDAQRAAGVVPFKPNPDLGETYYGMDYSGVTDTGVRVMGIVAGGAAAGRVLGSQLTWPLPQHWSLLDAATVPLPYAHAAYCLGVKTKMWRGMRVLVHGGAGALGQAVISLALAHDCEVFATVGDVRKKRFLRKLFPALPEDHIGNSRDISFGDMVLTQTKGKGCDIVIGNLKGELKNASFNCLAACGIFFDTAQLHTQEEYNFGMNYLTRERNYMMIDFSSVFREANSKELTKIQLLVADGIARGYVRPLCRVVYPAGDAARALRLLQSSRHRGRVVLDVRGDVPVFSHRVICSSDSVQAVVADNETFGLQVVGRLVSRGARRIHIHVSEGSSYLDYKIRCWQKQGVEVHVSTSDLYNVTSVTDFIQKSIELGPVEGLYVVTNKKRDDVTTSKIVTVLDQLDRAVRKLCPDVKNFVVITEDSDIGEEVCLQRVAHKLPATSVQLPKLIQVQTPRSVDNRQQLSWRGGVHCVELAAGRAGGVLGGAGGPANTSKHDLLAEIARLAEVRIPPAVSESSTLLELGMEPARSAAVAAFLRDHYSVALAEESIPALTVQKISDLSVSISGPQLPPAPGLLSLFSFVDADELLATTDMVFLSTLTNSATMRDDEFDVSQTYLCIVPGVEGHHARFSSCAARLKLPALVLQPGLDRTRPLADQAPHYAQILLKKTELKNNFYLLGYESGVIVALEMAAILEAQGHVGTVYCLGAGPKELQSIIREVTDNLEGDALRDLVLIHMFTLMGGSTTPELEKELDKVTTWNEKLDLYVRTLVGRVSHSSQYAKSLIEATYARIVHTLNYEINPKKLKSKLVVIHAQGHGDANELQAYSEQPIDVYELNTSLAHSAMDMRCSAIINKYLDSHIIEAFNNKNLCETYLLNADTFMSNSNES